MNQLNFVVLWCTYLPLLSVLSGILMGHIIGYVSCLLLEKRGNASHLSLTFFPYAHGPNHFGSLFLFPHLSERLVAAAVECSLRVYLEILQFSVSAMVSLSPYLISLEGVLYTFACEGN